ncbi:hypothetical protein RR46_04896 [Papilio xuthus]|uniref:Uncharacterized protein n=1 Tax=Papilio xuthus TaxID=66420 RepID=A0A194PTN0_PAPXU|nr:hypothetical protein RR46_04896 [Papilio xuthus]
MNTVLVIYVCVVKAHASRCIAEAIFGVLTIISGCTRSAMGAKQSKRSVDISGKEAEGAGAGAAEVAAAGAGGEGRLEQLADADAGAPLKPQLNGDAHIHEPSDKEKQLDSGTPENEKDATTEKENKEVEEAKEKDTPAVTNGDSEQKEENGDAAATPEEAKKPKKEKVKKKWSLRSISFSRKDKPKQEKKAKEDEAKTPNGETEKLPEERRPGAPAPIVRAHLSIMPPAQPTFHSALSAMCAQGSRIIIVTMSTTILGLQSRVNDLAMRILADVKSHGPELVRGRPRPCSLIK